MAGEDPDVTAGVRKRFDVFVQWRRGKPHEYAETIVAPDPDMALLHAKRNIDVRGDPISVWVARQDAMAKSSRDDPALRPSTDRSYRQPAGYSGGDGGDD